MKTDEIASNLGSTLTKFLSFFNNDLQRKVLELDSNIQSEKYFQELTRVSNSLEQYIKKDIGLFYVGFLGSYSSGKTSTINSLLDIWNTDKVRKVNNNPTDDCITLITNQSNVSDVFTFSKEGAISIRTNTGFDTPFLENIVVMDTPGSGDPNIIESIVRDSLPLCDLIIYTLNATAPFTDIDKPFLIAQQSKLSNIPILFVLTRADEYRKNSTIAISDDNFDLKRYTDDIKTIASRINEALSISEFNEHDFVLVDNKEGYNIDALIRRINAYTTDSEENLISLHNHKLSYFKNEVKNIHNYYLNLAITKIDKCEKFISKANDNIEYFDQQIEVSKMKFRALWNQNTQSFSRIYDGTAKGYIDGVLDDLGLVKALSETAEYQVSRNRIKEDFKERAHLVSRRLISKVEEIAFTEVTKLKNQLIELVDFETLKVQDGLTFDLEFDFIHEFPLDKQDYIKDYYKLHKLKSINDKKVIKDALQGITRSLGQKTPLDKINENIIGYKNDAIDILNLYYDAIKMYNVVAFSFEVKNYISDLGLAAEFDELESGEISKTKYNLLAEKELLGNFVNSTEIFEEELNKCLENSVKIKDKLNKIDLSFDSLNDELEISTVNVQNTYKTQDISLFLTDSYRTMMADLQTNLSELSNDQKALKNRRLRRYLIFSILPLIVIAGVWFGYKFINIQTPTSLLWTILIGVGCSLMATLIGSLTDKYKNRRYESVDKFKAKIQEKNDVYIREAFSEFKLANSSKQDDIAQQIQDKWSSEESELLMELSKSHFHQIDREILSVKSELSGLIETYKKSYTNFNSDILSLFNNHEELFSKIDTVAMNIKEDSIRPSFELLNKTMNEIELVKKEIEILDY